jgi:hypothetical protein
MPIPLGIFAVAGASSAAAGAYEQIATAYGTGSSATILFSSIPQTYKHLELRVVGRLTDPNGWESFALSINGAGMTKGHTLYANNGERISEANFYNSQIVSSLTSANANANSFGAGILTFLNYSNTATNKTIRIFTGRHAPTSDGNFIQLSSKFVNATAAITSIQLDGWNGAFWNTASRVSLYGIKG